MSEKSRHIFVSRAGEKLSAALDAFGINPAGWTCADFGANVGGFTDCLLQRSAAKIYAIDTGYGDLAWKLRNDPRVVVMERTNALYVSPVDIVDMVVIDVAWTPQKLAVPAAAKWLKSGGRIISLIKPHFELSKIKGRKPHQLLDEDEYELVLSSVRQNVADEGLCVAGVIPSPILGKGGNREYLMMVTTSDRF
ncbi:MAG TPA: SAM-dependent methyltransferase [Phycisphaerae bacterium]|nr:SAM-dependent methyltransferase [Phycisphaerae bacterium]